MPGYHRFRLPKDYHVYSQLDARGIAWEWLRRNVEFRNIWRSAAPQGQPTTQSTDTALSRSTRKLVQIPQHPLARRWSPWGLTFRIASGPIGA